MNIKKGRIWMGVEANKGLYHRVSKQLMADKSELGYRGSQQLGRLGLLDYCFYIK